jgi:purine-binding chemotaxis protein CheW
MTTARRETDWQAVHARLEEVRRTLEEGGIPSPGAVKRILRERARLLAMPREAPRAPAEEIELLVFSLSGERYAADTVHVLEVVPLRDLTPVPCTPPIVLGVINHRGRILPVLDLRRLLELPGQDVPEGSRVVAAEAAGMTFGLFAESVAGVLRVGSREVAPVPAALGGDRQGLLRGVAPGLITLLDLSALARNPRILVNDEIG